MELKLLSRLVTDRYRDRITESSRVSPAEVRTYYETHKNEYSVEPHFSAHQLVVYVKGNPAFPDKGRTDAEARLRAEEALEKIRAGARWDEAVSAYSDEFSKSRKDGLIRDGRFGFFAPEVEQASKTAPIGIPSGPIRSVFGYHIVQVVDRVTEKQPQSFSQVESILEDRLSAERAATAAESFMEPIREEMGLAITALGKQDIPLLDRTEIRADGILAEIKGKPVFEEDFQWFLKDALIPGQRMSAYSRPGTRQSMLRSYLDMLVLADKARKEGLDKTPEFVSERKNMAERLRAEFTKERGKEGSCPG
jgi:hypothetical protein